MAAITALINCNIDNVANLFIGIGGNTTASSTPDGINWTNRTLPAGTSWYNCTFGNDIAIAITTLANTTIAASSIDGITWVQRVITAAGASRGWYGCAFGNGIFVATTGGGATTQAASSTDGISWSSRTISSGDWRAVAYGNGTFIAVGYGSNTTQVSTDGISWSAGGNLPSSSNWIDICYDASLNRFATISITNGTIAAYSDDNGVNWSSATLPYTTTWYSITSNNNGRFVALSNATSTHTAYSDGITWSGSTMPISAAWSCVEYGSTPNVYVAVAVGGNNSAISTDGINWELRYNAAAVNYTRLKFANVSWRSADTLTINNGAVVTVNTDQKKFWAGMTITNGELYITNSSTTTGNRFITGRSSGAAVQTIAPASELGKVTVIGDWIEIGTGDTTSNQIMTVPFTDHIPCVWVETGSTYEKWLNVTNEYGATLRTYSGDNGLDMVSIRRRGKFFIQLSGDTTDVTYILTNSTTVIGSRTIVVSSTADIKTGASISGTGIPANAIVEDISGSTMLIINLAATAAASNVTVTLFNPVVDQLSNKIMFGNNIKGNTLLMGQKVKVPNIMMTSDTPVNFQVGGIVLAAAQVGMSITTANGPIIYLEKCMFDEAYLNFTQAKKVTIKNIGTNIPPLFSEIYDLYVEHLGIGLPPCRRMYSTLWIYRDVRAVSLGITITYCHNAILDHIAMCAINLNYAQAGSIGSLGYLNLGASNNITVTNLRVYQLLGYRAYHSAIAAATPICGCTFTDIEAYGMPAIGINFSLYNTFTNIRVSESINNYSWNYSTSTRVTYDPENEIDMVSNTKYYFKTRTFFTRDRDVYTESREYSSTPFLASGGNTGESIFPDYFTAYCNDNGSVLFAWTNRSPVHNNPSYEIHRSTNSGFTIDTSATASTTKVFSTNTAATVTWTHFGNKAQLTSTAATRTIVFNVNKTITVSGTTAIDFLTDTDGVTIGGGTADFRVGDTLIVTASALGNNGTYTITGVTSNVITVVEDLITETNTAGFVIRAHRPTTNKFGFTASAGRTLAFNVAKVITASSGSFIDDGHKVGDVITVSGTASNNKTFSLATVAALSMTVLETMATEAAVSANATITPNDIQNNVTYYYKLRKYDTASLYSDSAEIEITPTVPQTNKNLCLKGTAFTGSPGWTASNITVGSASRLSPYLNFATVANVQVADGILLTATNNNGTLTQSIPTTSGLIYTFGVWVCTNTTSTISSVAGQISLGTATQAFTATSLWQKVAVSFTATSTSTNAVIRIDTNTRTIVVAAARVNQGSSQPYLTTTTVPVINVNEVRDIVLLRSWCRSYGESPTHNGIEIILAAVVTGELWTEVYCSPTKGFTPKQANQVMTTHVGGGYVIGLNYSHYNTIDNLYGADPSAPQGYGLVSCSYSQYNTFKNINYDLGGLYMNGFITLLTMANNNIFKNWNILNWRNYTTASNPIITLNNIEGTIIENMIIDNSDIPINFQGMDTIVKGMSGANATPINAALTYVLGGTSDGMAVSYVSVYDTIFNELYFTQTKGALHILFNASRKSEKPYALTGATFSQLGRLYMINSGDTIEYTWPHKILGVSGFRPLAIKLNGFDLGTSVDRLEGLKIEYAIKTGATYSDYKEARYEITGTTTMNITGETISASDGFYFKLKLTSMLGMKYNARVAGKNFVVGEVIKGNTSLATAVVVRDFIVVPGTNGTGTIWLSGITGDFRGGEVLSRNSDADGRATNVLTNGVFPFFPSYTSYIDGLQIYTNIDQTVKYPDIIPTPPTTNYESISIF